MAGTESTPKIASLDELLDAREVTERISDFLVKRLRGHIATLAPLLGAGRVLGKHVGGRESAPKADEALAELAERYKQAFGPMDIRPELDAATLTAVGSAGIQIHPYEYAYEAHGSKGAKSVALTSPVRWVATFGADITLSQMRSLVAGPAGEARGKAMQRFVVSALAFQSVLERSASVAQLLHDLRYETGVQTLPGLERLPVMVIGVPVPSFRPADDLLLTAVRLSGVPAFIELIDTATLAGIPDPLREQIEALAARAS
jgi:hypothetical protein